MDNLIESIRAAVADDASAEARAAGVAACRAIISALEAKPGAPIAAAMPMPPTAAIGAMLRGMPLDNLLDLAIARLRAALPAGTEPVPVNPIRFQMVPITPAGGKP
jgi:hypothetical protein